MAEKAVVEVLEVSGGDSGGEGVLAGGGIDMPETGSVRPTFDLEIRGWAVGRSSAAIAAEVLHGGLQLGRVPLDVGRPKLAARHPATEARDNIGFRAMIGLLRLPADFELAIRAVTQDGARAPIGRLRGRREEIQTGFDPVLRPLMVTTLGRTGSMLLMQMLEAHPEVLVYRPFRYEQRVASYWLEVMLALSEPASYLRQIAPAGSLDERRWWLGEDGRIPGVGDEPLRRWMGFDAVKELAEVSQVRIERLYEQVAARLEDGPRPSFFAEKYALELSHLVWELYPGAREIFLVRDFRDMVSSIIAFNRKRGLAQGFGRRPGQSDRDYVASLGSWASSLKQSYERRSDRSILVRYEDLVLEPARTLGALLGYLGVESGTRAVEEMVGAAGEQLPQLAEHRTAADSEASIGRWRHDLDDDLLEVCDEAFRAALETFGYTR